MSPEYAIVTALFVCVFGALTAMCVARNKTLAGWTTFAFMVVASGFVIYAAARVIWVGVGQPITFWALPRWGFALRIYVDGLSALFVGLIALIAVLAAFYSIEYMKHYGDYGVGRYYPNLLLFAAGMYGIVCTTDTMFFFFVFWQLMTLTSYMLVRFEHRKPENIRAANRYLLMMQLACGLTMIGAFVIATSAVSVGNEVLMKYDFDAISRHLPELYRSRPGTVTVAFFLFLVGFGIKVGMWPFGQFWLPAAHPAAPSPVSAMLSGVMIKTGIYGLMRYFLWLVPAEMAGAYPSASWGCVIALLGTATLFIGTAQALKQDQTKRLLAYSSIGQMGYILLGLGTCLVLIGTPLKSLAALAFAGALFHTLNHGLFKSLLFLNAGSILYRTDTQDLGKLGGLMRFMPLTGLAALVGAFSISGVPLFNGFASKWNLYVAAIEAGQRAFYLPILAVIAILTSALTLACFVKLYGAAFLSPTSSLVQSQTRENAAFEVPWLMQLPQIILGLLCLVLGLLPVLAYQLIHSALARSQQGLGSLVASATPLSQSDWIGISPAGGQAFYAPIVLALVLAFLFLLVRSISKLGGSTRRSVPAWLCGYVRQNEQNRYGARGYYHEVNRGLRWVGGDPAKERTPVIGKPIGH